MTHKVIRTNLAPPPGNYSQGRLVDLGSYYMLYVSGQTGNHPETDEVVHGGIQEQTRQAISNIKGIMEEASGTLDDIVKLTIFIKNMKEHKGGFEKVYKEFFPEIKPARSLVEVSEIPLVTEDTIVMIEAVAYILHAEMRI